jgi:hypothetical protein
VGIIEDSVSTPEISKICAEAQVFFYAPEDLKEWSSPQNALAYLNVADCLPHRSDGESVLIEHLPEGKKRNLDLGTGDGGDKSDS